MELNEKTVNACLDGWKAVYDMLEDDISRDIYLNRLNWMISGDSRFIHHIVESYTQLQSVDSKIRDLEHSLPTSKPIVLYGAGRDGRIMLPYFSEDKRFLGFCSKTEKKQTNGYCGFPVMSPKELLSRKDATVIISSSKYKNEILQVLTEGEYPLEMVYCLTENWWEADSEQYFNPEFMKYEDEEVFVDAGCFDLGSSLTLSKYCKHVKKVYAFEPDPANYLRCLEQKALSGFTAAEILPFGTWSKSQKLFFNANSTMGSYVDENGSTSISVMPIDEAVSAGGGSCPRKNGSHL